VSAINIRILSKEEKPPKSFGEKKKINWEIHQKEESKLKKTGIVFTLGGPVSKEG